MRTGGILGAVAVATALAGVVACGGRDQAGKGPSVTLSGCLQPGDAPNTFRLSSVASPNGATGTAGGNRTSQSDNPTGTAARSQSSDIGASTTRVYTLIPTEKANLSMHEGTMVQVSGQLESNDAAGTSGSANRSGTSGTPGTGGSSDGSGNATTGTGSNSYAQGQTSDRSAATVRVDSVKRISGSCDDTTR